jgi:hypothetical protein
MSSIGAAIGPAEPDHPRAGQRVPPHWGGPGGISSSPYPVRLSLYEYSDGEKYTITGQSIAFLIPKFFSHNTDNQRGGPQSALWLEINPRSNGPYIPGNYPDKGAYERDRFNQLSISLTNTSLFPYALEKEAVITRGYYPMAMGMGLPSRLSLLDEKYCGYEVYRPKYRPKPLPRQFPKSADWPYTHPVVFGRTVGSRLHPVISCGHIPNRYGFPHCRLNSLYRGWPMSLGFNANNLCKADQLLAKAEHFLDQHRVGETQRTPGEKEYRYRPPRPGADMIPGIPGLR